MNSKLPILMFTIIVMGIAAPCAGWATDFSRVSIEALQLPPASPPLTAFQHPSDVDVNKKFVLILKLNDNQINKLRIEGSLSTRIPPKFVNRVGAIRFQRRVSFLSDPLKVVGETTEKMDRSISVQVDNTILERLAYQPVDLMVYESGFDRVNLKFNPLGMAAGKLPTEFQAFGKESGPIVYARINSQRGIYGTLQNFETLSIETQFGKVDIPSKEIAGIRFNDGNASRAFVVLKKGDVFSGEIDLGSLSIQSRWGVRKLEIGELESITQSRETVFLRDALDPSRWRLELILPRTLGIYDSTVNRIPVAPVRINPGSANPYQSNLVPGLYPQYRLPLGFPN